MTDASPEGLHELIDALDAVVVMSGEMANGGLYPAIDPRTSTSRLLDAGAVGDRQIQVARDARQLLAEARDAPLDARDARVRADRLRSFLTQPFFVAEPFTNRPGRSVSRADTIEGCEALLQGTLGELDSDDLYMIGSLDDTRCRP